MIDNKIMTNSITISLEALIRNYTDSMIGLVMEGDTPEDKEMNAEPFLRTLKNLLSPKPSNVIGTLRNCFYHSETMFFVPDYMEILEQWNKDEQDFCIVVKDDKDETLCILAKPEIQW
jgi:hypothetical protein